MDDDREFRFSPRPNRAAEIHWRPWGEAAFAEARRLGRPVLLSLSAVWCHWCHVMDETSYSDPRVIAAINAHFLPIRVDNDRHPDVNRRYNLGGWPTTAFLTASGDVVTGGTYVPPDQMLEYLGRVKGFFETNQAQIRGLESERAADGNGAAMAKLAGRPLTGEQALSAVSGGVTSGDDIPTDIALQIVRAFDPLHGGIGSEPKFPQADIFGFLLALVGTPDLDVEAQLPKASLHKVLRTTLTAMIDGDLYDTVEGGFFRYATQRDWSIPHYEKMLEDNARLVRLYAHAASLASAGDRGGGASDSGRSGGGRDDGEDELGGYSGLGDGAAYARAAEGSVNYLLATLNSGDGSAFGGSQDADEHYYLLDADGRSKIEPPYVDPTIYVDWNALAAGALLCAAQLLNRPDVAERALALLDHLWTIAHRGDVMAHFVYPDGEDGGGPALLGDQAATAAALLDAYEHSGERRWLRRAQQLAAWVDEHLGAPDGTLIDRLAVPGESAGLLAHPLPVLDDNAAMAEVFLRLEAHTGEEWLRARALETLAAWATRYKKHGVAAAPYGQALLRYLTRPAHIVIVGGRADPEARRLHAAALADPTPMRTVQWLDPSDEADAAIIAARSLPIEAAAAGFVCRGQTCSLFEP